MKRIYLFLIVTVLLLSCATLSSTPTPTLSPPPTAETTNTLPDPTDPTQLITVPAGETFEIVLSSNSSTGYRWKLVNELDASMVRFVQQDSLLQQPVMPGSGGVDVWMFQGVNAGDTTIVLGYYPPSNDTEPDETVTFSIHIE